MLTPKIKRVLLLIVVGLLAITIIGFGIKIGQAQLLKRSANGFVSNVLDGNADASYKQFSESAQKSTDTFAWKNQVTRFNSYFKGHEPKLQTSTEFGTFKVITYAINGKDGSKYIFTVTLKSAGLGWQVQSFTSNLATN